MLALREGFNLQPGCWGQMEDSQRVRAPPSPSAATRTPTPFTHPAQRRSHSLRHPQPRAPRATAHSTLPFAIRTADDAHAACSIVPVRPDMCQL
eukprot:4856542-Prymnesium_polylepis.1